MAAVEITISGTLFDKLNRTTQQVVLIGEASLTGIGVGGGPMPPGQGGGVPVDPGYGIPGGVPGTRPPPGGVDPGWGWTPGAHPSHPIARPDLEPSHPIMLPGMPGWPTDPPPTIPPPGSPPVMIPGSQPVHPITPPPAIIVDYPGVGKVLVPQPVPSGAAPAKK